MLTSTRRCLLVVMLTTASVLGGTAAFGSATASASVFGGYFCPYNGGDGFTIALNPFTTPGDRCAGPGHSTIAYVVYQNQVTPVVKCAVVKQNSDGSGGNVGGKLSCPTDNSDGRVDFPSPGVGGYPTGINDSSHYHTGFDGELGYYN
jgi:hypothetical protein